MMNGRLSDDLIDLTTKLMMARERGEIIHIAADFNSVIEKLIEAEKRSAGEVTKTSTKSVTTTLKFTKQEISKMATTFKKEFIANGLAARVTKRESGKRSYCYEIRYRSNGYNISASSTDLAEAKRKFLAKTVPGEIEKYRVFVSSNFQRKIPITFNAFALYYFENFRKELVVEKTYRNDLNRYRKYIAPFFGEISPQKITPSDCKKLLKEIKDQGKGKTADEIYSLMNGIFKSMIKHKLIFENPLDTILHIQHEREEGEALSSEEEILFIEELAKSECAQAFALFLFTGLRPNEYDNKKYPPEIHGDFIKAVNSKRKFRDKNKVEFKYIPICNNLRTYLRDGIKIEYSARSVYRRLKQIFPNHTLKDLRTTFYTRCQTFCVEEAALKEFMGHSFGKLGNAYSDLTKFKDYLLNEGKKLNKWNSVQ